MKKNMLMAAAMVSVMAAGFTAGTAMAADSWEIALSTPFTENETDPWGQGIAQFAQMVNERTDGAVTVNCFYSNALGAPKDMFAQLASGEIEMIMDGTITVDYYAPEYGFLAAPYMLKGPEHLKNLVESELFDGFEAKLKENHVDIIGLGIRNPRNLMTTGKFQWDGTNSNGLVIRVPDNSLYVDAWSALGASCQIIGGGEVYSSLQTGVINAFEGPNDQFTSIKMEELAPAYLYQTEHVTEFQCIYASDAFMASLPEDIAEIVMECAQEAMQTASDNAFAKSETAKQIMIDAGFEYTEDIDIDSLYAQVAPVWEERFATDWTAASYEEVMSYAE